jgi:CheY-like chemotaxis protein
MLSPEVLDLNELVRRALPALERVAGPEYLVDFERGERAPVRVDAAELEQAIANLVANARDSMPGGGRILVRAGCADVDAALAAAYGAPPGRYAMVRVSDHGAGIDAETLAQVFEPFFSTKPHGTGLGLAAVHGVVAQSGGVVVPESEPGRGSTFGIYLPLVDAAAVPTRRLSVIPGGPARETVLLAAADDGARDVMIAMLQEAGYDVVAAGDMASALELADAHVVSVLLTDLSLPGGDGPALARAVTAEQPDARVLVVSGRIDDAADAGGYPLLEKPFSADVLVDALRHAPSGSVGVPPV